MRKKSRVLAYFALFVVLALAYAWWAPKGMSRLAALEGHYCVNEVSPKGSYRVDICRPAFPYLSFSKDAPRFVRFYDQRAQRLLGESDVVEMAGRGEIFWPSESRMSILVGGGDDSPEISVNALDGQ